MVTLGLIELGSYKFNLLIEGSIFGNLFLFVIIGVGLTLFRMNYLFLLILFEGFTLVSILFLVNIVVVLKDPFLETFLLILLCLNATEIAIILSILVLFFNLTRQEQ
jgi:NADH:ubiquinone oxidoreductase subunit K